MTPSYRPLLLPRPTIDNLRDLGGRPADHDRPIKTGLLYRSAELSRCGEEDLRWLEELGIAAVVDFREEIERAARPDLVPAGAEYYHLSALPTDWAQVDTEDAPLLARLFDSDLPRFFRAYYRILAHSKHSAAVYRRFFDLLLRQPARPLLWHCTQGKDRAGLAAILLQTALGVDWEGCLDDYFLSNRMMGPQIEEAARVCRDEAEAEGLRQLNLVGPDCVAVWRKELDARWGGLEAYLTGPLGLDGERRELLRRLYLEAE